MDRPAHPTITSAIGKIARWSLWSATALMALMVGVHLLLPRLINSHAIKRKIIAAAQKAIAGEVAFDALRFNLVPLPSIELTGGRLELPDQVHIRARTLRVYPKLLPLFRGRIQISQADVQQPWVEIHLRPAPAGPAPDPRTVPPRPTEALANALTHLPPDIRLALRDGQLTLIRKKRPVVWGEAISAVVTHEGPMLRVTLQGRSNLAEAFEADVSLHKESLDATGQMLLSKVNTKALEAAFFAGPATRLPSTMADLRLSFESAGLQSLQCRLAAQTPSLVLTRNAAQVPLQGLALEGDLRWSGQAIEARLRRLDIATPLLSLSGALTWHRGVAADSNTLRLAVQVEGANITAWRSVLIAIAPGLERWALFRIVRGGTLSAMALETSGATWKEAGRLNALRISGSATEAHIVVPGVDLELFKTSGGWELDQGVLSVRQAAAEVAGSKAHNGVLSVGLLGETHPIDLSVDLDADLAQLPPLLKKVIPVPTVQAELARLSAVQGSAKGRLILSNTLEKLHIQVDAQDITLQAKYERLPHSIEVHGGQLRYDGRRIAFKEIRGRMGDLRLDGLNGQVALQNNLALQAALKGVIGPQSLQWAYDRFALPADFMLNAPIAVHSLELAWRQGGALGLTGAFALAPDLRVGVKLTAEANHFDLNPLTIADDRSDARIRVSHDPGPDLWQAGFEGHLERGTLAKLWLNRPQQTGWMRGSFSALWSMAQPGRAKVQGRLEAGELVVPMKSMGVLQIHRADLASGRNSMAIKVLDLSWDTQRMALTGDLLFTDEAIKMALNFASDTLDIGALEKRFNQRKQDKGPAAKEKAAPPKRRPLRGKIEVQARRLIYGPYQWESLNATVMVSPDRVTVSVNEATLCGIATLGTARWTPQGLWIEFIPSANRQTLQLTSGCLSGNPSTERIEGLYSISGKVTSQGLRGEELLRQMQGRISFQAVDGRISNAGDMGLITGILSYLRINKLVKGELPDLKERAFSYKSIQFELAFVDGRAELAQADIRSETLNMVAEGGVEMQTGELALTILVSPLTGVDTVVRHIPVVNKILQGTLIAIPVGVRGTMKAPKVIPLSPKAVGNRLAGILSRTLKAPIEIVEPMLENLPDAQNAQRPEGAQ
jgi:uncharacterized protein involved in outer membrane biogenesis